MKRKICLLLIFSCVCSLLLNSEIYAKDVQEISYEKELTMEQIDDILRGTDMPEDRIKDLDEETKRLIVGNIDENAKYVDVVMENNQTKQSRSTGIGDKIELTVTAFLRANGNQVDIFPTYECVEPIKPKGKDFFGYATSESYSVVPGERSNLIWFKATESEAWQNGGSAEYTNTTLQGYEHKGGTLGNTAYKMYIKGCFYYRVDIDVDSPVKKMTMSYAHDYSSGSSYAYSVSYKNFGISVTPNNTNSEVDYINDAFYLVY